VKHVIEPELSYLFVPKTEQSHIPIMDGIDRINRRNVITFAVANRFWGKFANPLSTAEDKETELLNPVGFGGVRDLAHWRIALGYDLDKERRGGDSLTDLDMNLRLNPSSYMSLSFDGGLDPGAWKVTQARTKLAVSDPRPITRRSLDEDFNRPSSFSISHYFFNTGANAIFGENANFPPALAPSTTGSFFGNVATNIFYHLSDHVLVSLNGAFNTRDNRVLGIRAATKLLSTCECWSVTLGVKRSVNPSKTSFNFDFNLLGIGSSRSSLQ
jgi:hypothetical protein